jgi:hypothetical protein
MVFVACYGRIQPRHEEVALSRVASCLQSMHFSVLPSKHRYIALQLLLSLSYIRNTQKHPETPQYHYSVVIENYTATPIFTLEIQASILIFTPS